MYVNRVMKIIPSFITAMSPITLHLFATVLFSVIVQIFSCSFNSIKICGLVFTWKSYELNCFNTEKLKRMPTALGILELSPTSILTKLEVAYLLNSDGIRRSDVMWP
jgi:hypothetical protein